jgi:DNA-binding GntR family transcriptional regulator
LALFLAGFIAMNTSLDAAAASPSFLAHGVRVELDRASAVPLYHQLAEQFRGAIGDGSMPVGSQLGNELAIADRFGVSRPTIRRAIQELVEQGLVVRRRGIGTQVVHDLIERPLRLSSLFDDLAQGAMHPQTTVLVNQIVPAPDEIASRLQVPPDEPVRRLRRLRIAGDEPLAILENFLPTSRVDITEADLEADGLYQAMRASGVRVRVANQRIGARAGTDEECRLLAEPPLSPMVTTERITHDDEGLPVEWGRHTYRASRYSFTVTLVGR